MCVRETVESERVWSVFWIGALWYRWIVECVFLTLKAESLRGKSSDTESEE